LAAPVPPASAVTLMGGARRSFASAILLCGGPCQDPLGVTRNRGPPRVRRGGRNVWGVWEAMSGPPRRVTRNRGPPRLRRGGPNGGGVGGQVGPPAPRPAKTGGARAPPGQPAPLGVRGGGAGPRSDRPRSARRPR